MKLKLLQLNIFCRPMYISNKGGDYRQERLQNFAAAAKDADVVCLQELFDGWTTRKMIKEFKQQLEDLGFKHQIQGTQVKFVDIRSVGSGLFIASKFPFGKTEAIEFIDHGHGNDYYIHKGFVFVEIIIQNHRLNLMQASYDDIKRNSHVNENKTDHYDATKLNQLKQIKAYIEANKLADHPLILTGDLNIDTLSSLNDSESRKNIVFDADSKTFSGQIFDDSQPTLSVPISELQSEINPVYSKLLQILNAEDATLKHYGGRVPVTFGDIQLRGGRVEPVEVQLLDKDYQDALQRLDYVFYFGHEKAEVDSRVEKFEYKGTKIKHLSDHFGHVVDVTFV